MQDNIKVFNSWLASGSLDAAEKAELEAIRGNTEEIIGRFGTNLVFGTGGLRGRMMLGTNAMNVYTVARATEGLAQYIKSEGKSRRSVIVGCDSRNNSKVFARTAASVLAGNGIHTYIFDDIRPTPELSFALRYLGCIAGINITASHNPKEYNGYKAYWEDGAQLAPEQAEKIAEYMNSVDIWTGIHRADFDKAVSEGHIKIIGPEIDEAYLSAVMSQAINLCCVRDAAAHLNIVFTPLNGTGYKLIPEVLRRIGITNLHIVPEQAQPDGNFPTTPKPNPEYRQVFECGMPLADKVGSDLIIATDPDADRVGVMARGADGKFVGITGNQMASLLLDYIINAYTSSGKMPPAPYAVKTIVTTELMSKICRAGGVELYNVLTGFKFIGEVIKKKEAEGSGTFIFGAEESYGYLKGTHARDKDSVVSTMLICEMTAYYRNRGMTLVDALNNLYKQYGYSLEKTDEVFFDGYGASEKMKNLMHVLRNKTPDEIAGFRITSISDYLDGSVKDLTTGKISDTGLPRSDVLRWQLVNSDVIIIRPSGTEPKVKIYYLLSDIDEPHASAKLEKYKARIAGLIKA